MKASTGHPAASHQLLIWSMCILIGIIPEEIMPAFIIYGLYLLLDSITMLCCDARAKQERS